MEDLVRATYDQIHPGDTFDDLQRRAKFDKQDKGLLRDWMAVAAALEGHKLRVAHQLDSLLTKLDRM